MKVLEYRIQKGITQSQLAKSIGVQQSTISQYETGATRPSLTTLIRISATLGVTIDALLEDERKTP